MVDVLTLFAAAGFIILIGFVGEYVFQKTNIPDVIWLMLLGIAIGFFTDFKNSDVFTAAAPIFTTFALIFILFEGAINIDIKKLIKGIAGGSSLSFLNFVFSLLIVTPVMMLVGWGFWEGLLLGAIIGGASSAVIIPITKRLNVRPQTSLVLTLESAISDVLCIVGAITILNIILLQSFNFVSVLQKIVLSFGIAIFIGVLGGLIWIKLQQKLEQFTKSYMTTIAAILLMYSFVEFLGSNGAIACLSFGIIVGNAKRIFSFIENENGYSLTPSAKFFFSEISFFVKSFFFVYLGFLIDVDNFGLIIMGFLLTVLLYIIRPWAVSISNRGQRLDDKDRVFMEVLVPKGLAAAVLAQVPAQSGIAHGEQFSTIVLSVIFFSILMSTIAVYMTERDKFHGVKQFLDLRKFFAHPAKRKH